MSDIDKAQDAIVQWQRAVAGYARLLEGLSAAEADEQATLPIVEFTAADHGGEPIRICLDLNRLLPEHRHPVVFGMIAILVEDYAKCLDQVITLFTALENQHLLAHPVTPDPTVSSSNEKLAT